MQNQLDIYRDVSARFRRAGINYMLTGSMALAFYAEPRMARNIDVVVELASKDIDPLLELFSADYFVSEDAVREAIRLETFFNMVHYATIIKVDCILRKNGAYRRTEFDRRQRVRIEDFSTWIVSKEDLIISKLWWARDFHSELQLRDVRNLADTGCDRDYVNHWTRELGLTALWEEASPEPP